MRRYIVYFWYVIKHKWFVVLECFKQGLIWQGLVHDNSKFHLKEFFHYAKVFYDSKGRKQDIRNESGAYNAAQILGQSWQHHYVNNPHHWQYWVMIEELVPVRIFKIGNIIEPPVDADVLNKTAIIIKDAIQRHKDAIDNPKLLMSKIPEPLMGIPHIDYEKVFAAGRTVLQMPIKYIKEMLCDWIGAAKAQGSKPNIFDFWENNKFKMDLHPETRRMIEQIIHNYTRCGTFETNTKIPIRRKQNDTR